MTPTRNGAAPVAQLYYRIQPAGLGIDHRSETSATRTEIVTDEDGREYERDTGEPVLADGLHVFSDPRQVFATYEGDPERYGDEVVVIEAESCWPNGDAEGVCIDGSKARVVSRIPLAEFRPEGS